MYQPSATVIVGLIDFWIAVDTEHEIEFYSDEQKYTMNGKPINRWKKITGNSKAAFSNIWPR